MNDPEIVKEYYDKEPKREWDRLEGFHFEYEITKTMIQKHLRPGSILDIGGGPGRYSMWLAQMGLAVTLVDLSDGNVAFAKAKAKELGLSVRCYQGNAMDLTELPLDQYDNILLMGPLYHLSNEEDRAKCVREAKRLLKPGGVLFASFISMTGGINYYLDECPYEMMNEPEQSLFDAMEADHSWSGNAFTKSTFIDNDEIIPFFERLGMQKITMFGQEGITAPRLRYLESGSEEVRKYYLDVSLRLCEKSKYFAYSSHILYIGKALP